MTLSVLPHVIRQQLLELEHLSSQLINAILEVVHVLEPSLQPFAYVR
jgi:hypothetical protein